MISKVQQEVNRLTFLNVMFSKCLRLCVGSALFVEERSRKVFKYKLRRESPESNMLHI